METTVLVSIIGITLAFITCVGGLIVRDRAILALISSGDKATNDSLQAEIKTLHERINKTRDDFVRRDDLDQHMKRIEGNLEKMYSEQRETNQRIDGFMTAMVKDHNDRRTK